MSNFITLYQIVSEILAKNDKNKDGHQSAILNRKESIFMSIIIVIKLNKCAKFHTKFMLRWRNFVVVLLHGHAHVGHN